MTKVIVPQIITESDDVVYDCLLQGPSLRARSREAWRSRWRFRVSNLCQVLHAHVHDRDAQI